MYIFIVNPVAGNGRGHKVFQQLQKLKLYSNLKKQEFITEYEGHAEKIAQEITEKYEKIKTIVVIGGDGTLHEVVNGLSNHNIPISFIPAGSENDFYRGAKLPNKPTDILKNIGNSREKLYWYGKCDTKERNFSFVNCVGVGFDAVVANRANRSILKKF